MSSVVINLPQNVNSTRELIALEDFLQSDGPTTRVVQGVTVPVTTLFDSLGRIKSEYLQPTGMAEGETVAVANGGTGSSTPEGARVNLGVVFGTAVGNVPVVGVGGTLDRDLIPTGTGVGDLIALNSLSQIDTSLLQTGTGIGDLITLNSSSKIDTSLLQTGTEANDIPLLTTGGLLPSAAIPSRRVTYTITEIRTGVTGTGNYTVDADKAFNLFDFIQIINTAGSGNQNDDLMSNWAPADRVRSGGGTSLTIRGSESSDDDADPEFSDEHFIKLYGSTDPNSDLYRNFVVQHMRGFDSFDIIGIRLFS